MDYGVIHKMPAAITHVTVGSFSSLSINSSPPGQNGRNLADDVFKCNFVNEKFCIAIQNSLKFIPKVPFDNKPALV